jgi:hypothetical protein
LEGVGDRTSFDISSAKTRTAFQDITDIAGMNLNGMKNVVHHSEATQALVNPIIAQAQAIRDSVVHPLLPGNMARQEDKPLILFSTARIHVRPISAAGDPKIRTSVIYEQFRTVRFLIATEDGADMLIRALPLHNIALPYPHLEHASYRMPIAEFDALQDLHVLTRDMLQYLEDFPSSPSESLSR